MRARIVAFSSLPKAVIRNDVNTALQMLMFKCIGLQIRYNKLGFGNGLVVKSPRQLVKRMTEQSEGMYRNYGCGKKTDVD